jgi:hypothetical protein
MDAMALNARRRPLVTDGASGIDQLSSKIRHPNNRNRRGLQATSRHAKTTKLILDTAGVAPRLEVYSEVTADIDEMPWPPPGDGWCAVFHDGGATKWRRIVLEK